MYQSTRTQTRVLRVVRKKRTVSTLGSFVFSHKKMAIITKRSDQCDLQDLGLLLG